MEDGANGQKEIIGAVLCLFASSTINFNCIFNSIHRETKEVLVLQMKKGNHLGQTSCLRDLWIPLGDNILVL